jgi:uncharacterized repeat protein (TIGR01451 family)
MNKFHLKQICLAVSLASVSAYAAELELSGNQPVMVGNGISDGDWGKPGYSTEAGEGVYIVEFVAPPVATYNGGIKGLKATSNRSTGAKKLNTNSKESKAYRKYLKQNQDKFVANIGAQKQVKASYQYVFNGVAVTMSAGEAEAIASRPDVKKVYRERMETLNTDNGPQWIDADKIWGGPPNNVSHSQGEGIVIAVLDSGINHGNPSFADVGGDGYDHSNPLGSGNYVPGSYCDTTDPSFCNDKLIGAWSFVPGDANYPSPEDSDGHGSHTASTAGGNVNPAATTYAPTTSLTRAISGVAPHANIIAYDVCIDGCPGSALLAALDQVVIDAANLPDGIHALNYSISGGEDPYNDPVEIGFLNATAAGVYVSASAGNAGPGASTLGHQSPWVATTGASTHDRVVQNSLVAMSSDQGALGDITSVGFTAGYGPAPIVYAGDYPTANGSDNDTDPAQCLDPFPAGHFNGEIVVCDRGTIARVDKGANVLAGGAGGLVLANLAGNGESVSGDAHYLPAVHVGVTDGDTLKAWIAGNSNTEATITGYELDIDESNGDIMAGFSSRGPNSTLDILKPDVTAPGVDILAALNAPDPSDPAVYGFLSGTSMSSPHNAGAGAIVSGAQPGWTPYAVRSAIMMTSDNSKVLKEDGVTPADPLDMGAGRINLARAVEVDLVLDETPENFWAANPDTGGDPRALNIASMQDGACLANCSWTRTLTNTAKHTVHVDLSASGSDGAVFTVEPSQLKIKGGQTGSFTVHADSRLAEGWNFGQVDLKRRGDGPDLHMPIALQATTSSNPGVFTKTVDKAEAGAGDLLSYTISITNGLLAGQIDLLDTIPGDLIPIPESASEVIVGGSSTSPFAIAGNTGSWSGTLDVGGLTMVPSPAPFGYVPLKILGVAPFGCPSNCDDGSVILNVPGFIYNGAAYSSVIWSVNGTLEVGAASGVATSFANQNLPDATPPNNLLAPFWTDLNMGSNGDGAEWYVGVLNAGPRQFTVYEWDNIPLFGDQTNRYSFQIWVENGASGNIWYSYAQLGVTSGATVGLENADGTVGDSYWFEGTGTSPAVGTDLKVNTVAGGSATFTFDAIVDSCSGDGIITNEASISESGEENRAIAVTRCID